MDGISACTTNSSPSLQPLDSPSPDASTARATARSAPHLTFHGGKVLDAPGIVSLFAGKFWDTTKGKEQRASLERFAQSWSSGLNLKTLKEYGVRMAKALGGAAVSAESAPKRVTDNQIRSMVSEAVRTGALKTDDPQAVFTVYLPPGTELVAPDGTSSREGMGGYHMSFDTPDGRRLYYAAIAYSTADNGIDITGKPLDNITVTSSHEWAEAATDPDVNNGKLGWYDERYGEVADIVIDIAQTPSQVFGRLDGFAVQREWSEKQHRTVLTPAG